MNRFWRSESADYRVGLLLLMLLCFLLAPTVARADYSVTTSVSAHGTISPASALISSGSATTFTITPDPGYHVWTASGCQGGITGNTYTTGAITGNCTVGVIFAPNATPSISTDMWTPTGPETGLIRSMAIDPQTPTTIYAATFGGGILKTEDGGATWIAKNSGLPNLSINRIAIDPVTPSTLYTATYASGLYKSTDSGQSWFSVGNLSDALGSYFVRSIAIDPATPSTLYVSTDRASVLKSTNGGLSWTSANSGISFGSTAFSIAIDPLTPSILYASSCGVIYKSTDGGANWSATATAPTSCTIALAIDPAAPSTIYAGTNQNGVYKSSDSGANWTAANTGMNSSSVYKFSIDPVSPSTIYAASTAGGVFRTDDGAATWTSIFPGLAATPVFAIEMNPVDRNTVYAGTYSGVYKSVDGGTTYDFANKGLMGYYIESIAADPVAPSKIYMGTSGCFLRSSDSGANWQIVNYLFASRSDGVYSLAIDPVDPSIIYASGFTQPSARYTQSGAFFSYINVGPSIFAIDPLTHTTVYAGSSFGGMSKSIDSGATWSAINTGLTSSTISALAIDPHVPATLYAGTGSGMYKTTSSGSTWSAINSGLTTTYINTLAVDPLVSSTVYAGTESGVFLSSNAGNSWSPTNSGLTDTHVKYLAIDPVNTAYMYAGTQGGIFKSGDAGSTWNALNSGLPSGPVSAFAHAAASPPVLYAAVTGAGLFKYADNITYTVATNAGPGGTISPSSAMVSQGSITTFSVDPAPGYRIDTVTGCGGILAGNTYTTGPVTDECTVSATFSPLSAISVTLSANPASPQLVNIPATFTAVASGGTGSYQYKFWRRAPGEARYTMVQDYSYSNTLAWDTQGASPGTYTIMVYAKSAGSSANYEALKSLVHSLVEGTPVAGVTLTPNAASPHVIGTAVTFTAAASGGTGSYQYKFWRKAPGAAVFTMEQDYSGSNTWSWNAAPGDAGTHTILVYARNAGSAATFEASKSASYSQVTAVPASGVTLVPTASDPHVIGTPVTFTAVASGGTGSYQYKFLRKAPGAAVFTMEQDYSGSSTWSWNATAGDAGTHTIQVQARNVGSTAAYEAYKNLGYSVVTVAPVATVTLTSSPTGSQFIGSPATFTATASGGTGTYQYKFLKKAPGAAAYVMVQDYSESNRWDWNTTAEALGTHTVQVQVRNAGSPAAYEKYLNRSYVLK